MLSRGIIYCLKKTCSTPEIPRLLVCDTEVYLEQNDINTLDYISGERSSCFTAAAYYATYSHGTNGYTEISWNT